MKLSVTIAKNIQRVRVYLINYDSFDTSVSVSVSGINGGVSKESASLITGINHLFHIMGVLPDLISTVF